MELGKAHRNPLVGSGTLLHGSVTVAELPIVAWLPYYSRNRSETHWEFVGDWAHQCSRTLNAELRNRNFTTGVAQLEVPRGEIHRATKQSTVSNEVADSLLAHPPKKPRRVRRPTPKVNASGAAPGPRRNIRRPILFPFGKRSSGASCYCLLRPSSL